MPGSVKLGLVVSHKEKITGTEPPVAVVLVTPRGVTRQMTFGYIPSVFDELGCAWTTNASSNAKNAGLNSPISYLLLLLEHFPVTGDVKEAVTGDIEGDDLLLASFFTL